MYFLFKINILKFRRNRSANVYFAFCFLEYFPINKHLQKNTAATLLNKLQPIERVNYWALI
jgi:hypothetical protein